MCGASPPTMDENPCIRDRRNCPGPCWPSWTKKAWENPTSRTTAMDRNRARSLVNIVPSMTTNGPVRRNPRRNHRM
jgi:hypothetical protein